MVNLKQKQQGSFLERRIAERQLTASKLVPERLELEEAYEQLAGEREVVERRWTAQRIAAELAPAKRVADYDWQRTVEQAGPVQPRFRRLDTIYREQKLIEREANEWLGAIRNEAGGTSSERPVAERVNTDRTESVAVKQAAERVFEGTANDKPAEINAFPIPVLQNSVSKLKAMEREDLAGDLTAFEQIAEVAICESMVTGHSFADIRGIGH
jgi:hypothetical protein